MKYIKLFKIFEDFTKRINNGYVKFDSTYNNTLPDEINSFDNFRSDGLEKFLIDNKDYLIVRQS